MANRDPETWSISGVDLHLDIDRSGGRGLRAGLEDALRGAIRSGRLGRGSRLPPTRALARDLGMSRGTVQEAYAQLAAEGWIRGRQGSGTVVAIDAPRARTPQARPHGITRWRYDLRPGRPDVTSFPRALWLRALKEALGTSDAQALGYADPAGQLPLRVALAGYLARARGLRVTPGDLVITGGFSQALGIVARALAEGGSARVGMEDPGMPLHRRIVASAGHVVVPLPVDDDGVRADALESAADVRAVVLTPNRQHPTGSTLRPDRRARIVAWARERDALLVEDDYDGEFRYDRQPLAPLQALDPERVIYAGTTSKTLAPGLRLGWLAAPPSVRHAIVEHKVLTDWHTGALEQLALTEMLRSSAYDRHIRRVRLRYRRRRDALVGALGRRLPAVEIRGAAAGLNVLLPLPDVGTEEAVLNAARARGVGVEGLTSGGYCASERRAGLIVGYAAAAEHSFGAALEALLSALESVLA